MEKEKKLNVKFKDKENMLCKVEIEITERNGYPEFSMCGECSGSMGQCGDSIKPADNKQKRLLEIWKTYHLNGMNSGTQKQEELLKNMKEEYEYDRARCFLDSYDKDGKPLTAYDLQAIKEERTKIKDNIDKVKLRIETLEELKIEKLKDFNAGGMWVNFKDLDIERQFFNTRLQLKNFFSTNIKKEQELLTKLEKHLQEENEKTMLYDYGTDGKLYSYGSTWHRVDLPKGLWKEVTELVKDINKIEELKKVKGGNWEDIHDYKLVALGKHLGLEPKEAEQDITGGDDLYSYCGVDYYVLTENEAYDRCEDYLDELWQMAVENGNTEKGKAEWIEEVISMDGYGQILNGYDGISEYDDENEVYIMRC